MTTREEKIFIGHDYIQTSFSSPPVPALAYRTRTVTCDSTGEIIHASEWAIVKEKKPETITDLSGLIARENNH